MRSYRPFAVDGGVAHLSRAQQAVSGNRLLQVALCCAKPCSKARWAERPAVNRNLFVVSATVDLFA